MEPKLSARLSRWRDSWQALAVAEIIEKYAEDAVHESPSVKRLFPDNDAARLEGRAAIAEFVAVAAARLRSFRIEPFSVFESGDVSVIEYSRIANGDEAGAIKVCEVIVWRGDRVVASRVYHA